MIIKEFYMTRKDGVNLYRTYSDADVCIRKVGTEEVYAEAIDVEHAPFTYVETDKAIETEQTESEQAVPIQDGFEIVN
jgi:hypothetical protein